MMNLAEIDTRKLESLRSRWFPLRCAKLFKCHRGCQGGEQWGGVVHVDVAPWLRTGGIA